MPDQTTNLRNQAGQSKFKKSKSQRPFPWMHESTSAVTSPTVNSSEILDRGFLLLPREDVRDAREARWGYYEVGILQPTCRPGARAQRGRGKDCKCYWLTVACLQNRNSSRRFSLQIAPVGTNANFRHQRHRQRMRLFHLLAHQRTHLFQFSFRDLENELVVHL